MFFYLNGVATRKKIYEANEVRVSQLLKRRYARYARYDRGKKVTEKLSKIPIPKLTLSTNYDLIFICKIVFFRSDNKWTIKN